MRTKSALIALSAAVVLGVLGAGSVAQASDNTGDYSGGFVVPGDSAVNPAYHPRWFGGARKGGDAFGYVASRTHNTVRPAAPAREDNYGSEAGKE
jgi:ABC-type sugar transport system substrate-binding protein